MGREFMIQSQLAPVFPYVPEMVGLCTDENVIGGVFYVMERLDGVILRQELPAGVTLSPDQAAGLSRSVLDRLVDLHGVDPTAAGLTGLGKGEGYIRRQVAGWSDRYVRALTPDVPGFEEVMAWLDRYQPADVASCVIHNDFRFDNVVLDPDPATWDRPTAVRGVLDWELATIGDPLMDLGGALAYWVQADDSGEFGLTRLQPTHLPGMPTRAEVVAYYCERTGRSTDNWPFYEVFGLFRLAVIVQQIYYRYYHGQTTNPAFQHFALAVGWLQDQARKVMGE
jgi:aminoglycoside phosphotransferase (APT) family kinase protein